MWTSTVILTGTVVIEGTAFRWLVTDGPAQHLTVSHPTFGTRTQQVTASPESQARDVGRALLGAATGFLEAVDDTPMPDGDAEPTSSELTETRTLCGLSPKRHSRRIK